MPPAETNSSALQQHAAPGGNVPHVTANDSSVQHDAVSNGTSPQVAAPFGNMPRSAVRKESHTLTVKQVARMFEAAGVSRIERTIVNWCQPNRHGVARLDAYFDPNEYRYLITLESVERAIKEEQAKATSVPSESFGNPPHDTSRNVEDAGQRSVSEAGGAKELEKEIFDLKAQIFGKDFAIMQLRQDRQKFIDDLMQANQRIGELNGRLLQLEAPSQNEPRRVQVISESEPLGTT